MNGNYDPMPTYFKMTLTWTDHYWKGVSWKTKIVYENLYETKIVSNIYDSRHNR